MTTPVKRYEMGTTTGQSGFAYPEEQECDRGDWVRYSDHAAALADARKARRALEALTPWGSEFHNDPERCAAFVRDRLGNLQESVKRTIQQRNDARKVIEECVGAMSEAAVEISNWDDPQNVVVQRLRTALARAKELP